jgi:hypothetical protein
VKRCVDLPDVLGELDEKFFFGAVTIVDCADYVVG